MRSSTGPLAGRGKARVTGGSGVRLQILGPLRAWRDGVELDVGPRQQACLLAVLLARSGRPVSMDRLIELIWDDASPASAVNVIHKYVGTLRRLLEPSVRARDAGSYVQRRGNGYLFEGSAEEADIVAFRTAVQAARAELVQGRDETALDRYVEALGRWHGPAGDLLAPQARHPAANRVRDEANVPRPQPRALRLQERAELRLPGHHSIVCPRPAPEAVRVGLAVPGQWWTGVGAGWSSRTHRAMTDDSWRRVATG